MTDVLYAKYLSSLDSLENAIIAADHMSAMAHKEYGKSLQDFESLQEAERQRLRSLALIASKEYDSIRRSIESKDVRALGVSMPPKVRPSTTALSVDAALLAQTQAANAVKRAVASFLSSASRDARTADYAVSALAARRADLNKPPPIAAAPSVRRFNARAISITVAALIAAAVAASVLTTNLF